MSLMSLTAAELGRKIKSGEVTAVQAAQEALNGADNTGGATCFSRASSGHAGVVIGNHVFY